uniref:Uncharacterized protein n=1 Tax=Parascaris univalens TaxID=6257 RepID=A0A915BU93_PARUN
LRGHFSGEYTGFVSVKPTDFLSQYGGEVTFAYLMNLSLAYRKKTTH